MESLYLLIPLSVLVALAAGLLFWWSSRTGQFDDLEGPAHRLLQDDDAPITATAVTLMAANAGTAPPDATASPPDACAAVSSNAADSSGGSEGCSGGDA
jgi:cbb3-type cytochrome oxidase maturation protein